MATKWRLIATRGSEIAAQNKVMQLRTKGFKAKAVYQDGGWDIYTSAHPYNLGSLMEI